MNTYYKTHGPGPGVGAFSHTISHNRLISLTQINGLNTEQSLFTGDLPKTSLLFLSLALT